MGPRGVKGIIVAGLLFFSVAFIAEATSLGAWVYTGSMNTARTDFTATLLNNGSILTVTGSLDLPGTAELYNAGTGVFNYTGNPAYDGSGGCVSNCFSATMLNNGLVLVAGGNGNSGCVTSAELYNPANGTFVLTGSMRTARCYPTATLLSNGMVLIAGGSGGGTSSSSAELYNPATGTFTTTGSMNTPRIQHTATLLNNGTVLIAGGLGTNGTVSSAELYNPATATFTPTGGLNTARCNQTATLLNGGMVLVVGGDTGVCATGYYTASAELYNPATGVFTTTGSLHAARSNHTATLLNNGMVLVAGGYGRARYYPPPVNGTIASAELYDPATAAFTFTGGLNTSRATHVAALLTDGNALIAGGYTRPPTSRFPIPLSSAELYQPSSLAPAGLQSVAVAPVNPWLAVGNSMGFTAMGTFSGGQEQLASVTWSSSNTSVATVTNDSTNRGNAYGVAAGTTIIKACAGSVCGSTTLTVAPHENLILGSECGDASGGTLEQYDDTGNLLRTGNLSMVALADQSATLLKNGTIFVAGGNGFTNASCGEASAAWEIFSPNGQILNSGLLQNPRYSAASALLQNGNVFLAGGEASANFSNTWEIYSPTGALVSSGLLNDSRGPGVMAVTLKNGNVWISGSSLGGGAGACTYEIHSSNGVLVTSGSLESCFAGAQIQALGNGNVMLLGGDNAPGTYEIRSQTGSFVSTGSLTSAFNDGASSALLNNGNVFIFGSCVEGGALPTPDEPNPPFSCPSPGATSTWEIRDQNGNFVATGSLQDQRAGAGAAILSNGNVFITGGSLCPGCWEIWTQTGKFVSLGSLFDTRYGGHTLTHF